MEQNKIIEIVEEEILAMHFKRQDTWMSASDIKLAIINAQNRITAEDRNGMRANDSCFYPVAIRVKAISFSPLLYSSAAYHRQKEVE